MFNIFAKLESRPCTIVIQGLDKKIITVIDQDEEGDISIYSGEDGKHFLIAICCFDEFEQWDIWGTVDQRHNVFFINHD
jgi:hypothetical protein